MDLVPPERLTPLFEPASVAIIGASANPAKPGGQPLKALLASGYQGAIYPINPKYETLRGLACYPDLAALPKPVDLAIIALPAEAVGAALKDCAAHQTKAAIVLSSGFAEAGPEGSRLQAELTDLAKKSGLVLCGPNCMGVISGPSRLMANFLILRLPEEAVVPDFLSFISQSGSLGAAVCEALAARGLGLSRLISSGNEAALDFADYVAFLAQDPHTRVIAGYLEGMVNPAKLAQAAELAAIAGKPVLIIKAGRTELGAQAVGRHTGHQVGSDQEYQALFQRTGVVRLNSLAELMAASTILAAGKKIAGDRVGVLSPFGGAGVLLTDECLRAGLRMAELAPSTTAWLAERLPSFASTLNPVDVTPQVMIRHELVEECAGAILADVGVDILIVCSWIWEGYEALQAESLSRISKETKKLVVNLVWGPVESARKVRRALHRLRVPAEEEAEVITAALAGLASKPSEGT